MEVRELELDLDAFEGPFYLLLTLVLKEELEPAEVDVAGIVVAFCERLAERGELDLEACGEFLVLVAALLWARPDTRVALYVAPFWFGLLAAGYSRVRQRSASPQAT